MTGRLLPIASRLDATALAVFAFCFPGIAVLLPLAVVPLTLAVALACFLADRLAGRPLGRVPAPVLLPALLFAGWALLSALWAIDPANSLQTWARLLPTLVAGAYLIGHAAAQPEARRRRLAGWLIGGFALALAVLVFERLSGLALNLFLAGLVDQAPASGSFRLNRLNRGAASLAILAWPAAAALAGRLAPGRRWTALLLPLATTLLLVFYSSSSAVLAGAAALATALVALAWPRATKRLLLATLAVALLAMPFAAKGLSGLGLAEDQALDFSLRHRVFIWDYTSERIAERPLTGWGFDASRDLATRDAPRFEDGREALPLHPHNAALQVWAELGGVGLLLGGWLLLALLGRLREAPPLAAALDLGLAAAVLVVGLISYGIWQYHWLVVPPAAFALARALPGAAPPKGQAASES